MEGLLILIAFWVGIPLLGWIFRTISKVIQYRKYLARLRQLEPMIDSIDFSVADSELNRLQSLADTTFSRLKQQYNISEPEEPISLGQFIKADADIQRAKNRSHKRGSRIFRRRFWR